MGMKIQLILRLSARFGIDLFDSKSFYSAVMEMIEIRQ